MGRAAKNARAVFDYLEKNPIIDIGKTAEELKLAFSIETTQTATAYLHMRIILQF